MLLHELGDKVGVGAVRLHMQREPHIAGNRQRADAQRGRGRQDPPAQVTDVQVNNIPTATYNLLKEHLGEVLNGLPPREVRILQLRYGLLDGQAYTLEEVGRKMGVTRERVRQIEAQALSRLRHPSIRRKLRDYLGE